MNDHDATIAALSTPPGESGIAVIRVSGPDALQLLSDILRANNRQRSAAGWKHRRLYHGHVYDEDGDAVDDVMCAVMRAPESYTGEDTFELSCHGNTGIISRILRLLYSRGARPAGPGEFTQRAFLNGKMDLIQAEAVADLIHARSDLQREVAQRQLAGHLSEEIAGLADEMLGLLGEIEANIDFIEEEIDTLDVEGAIGMMNRHDGRLGELLRSSSLSRPFREGYKVVIAGPVNAGKSSLFNRLLDDDRAIVTEVPGTTRDVLREAVVFEGLIFVLHDTAGLRGTDDRVETIGIDLARSAASAADVVLFVVDGSEPMTPEVGRQIEHLDPLRAVLVVNKMDLRPRDDTSLTVEFPGVRVVGTSMKSGRGLDELRSTLIDVVGREDISRLARERVVLNARLIGLLEGAREGIDVLRGNLRTRAPLEMLAVDARSVLEQYESATGKRYTDDLLDVIFSRFCIGK